MPRNEQRKQASNPANAKPPKENGTKISVTARVTNSVISLVQNPLKEQSLALVLVLGASAVVDIDERGNIAVNTQASNVTVRLRFGNWKSIIYWHQPVQLQVIEEVITGSVVYTRSLGECAPFVGISSIALCTQQSARSYRSEKSNDMFYVLYEFQHCSLQSKPMKSSRFFA